MSYAAVVIFGGDTDPGYRVAQKALAAGLKVVAVVRPGHDHDLARRTGADIVLCDLASRESIDAVLATRGGPDTAVVCILGGTPQLNTQGNIAVIDAAVAAGVKRFVLTTSIGFGDSSAVLDPFLKAVAGRAIRAKEWAEKHLFTTALEWTIVRAGGTTRLRGTGGAMLTDSTTVSGYISLNDLGDMLWLALASPRTVHRALAAVDSGKAFNLDGAPVVPAEL